MPARHQTLTPRAATARTVLALLLLAALSACGQKGPLFLPERTPMVIGEEADDETDADEASARPPAVPDADDTSEAERAADGDDDDDDGDDDPQRVAPETRP